MPDAIVTTGSLRRGRLTVRSAGRVGQQLSRWRDGEVAITIARKRATRSLNQNAWYWGGIIHALSEHTGYTPEEMHDYLKQTFIPKRLAIQDGNGDVVDEKVIGSSTTKLSKGAFAEYCETIRQWAATDLDLCIEDPC